MISGSLTVDDMRLIAAIGDLFAECPERPISLTEISSRLKSRGFAVGNGMTRELNDLETKIGGKLQCGKILLNRQKRGSTLTLVGQEIVQQIRTVLQTLGEMRRSVDSGRSVVRIGLTNSLASNMFPRVLKETDFLARHPNVNLEIVEGEPHELVGLWQTRVDFAVGPKDVNNGFLSKPLFRCKRVLLYSRNVQYKKTSPGRSDFADSSLRVAGLNTFACNLAGGFPGMANSEKSRFNLFGREILTVVTVRQACECQCQGHQVQKLTIFSLNVAWFGHTAFSDQLWGIRAFSDTKNGPAGIPQARQGNVLDMALSCCQDGGPCIA